MQWRDAHNQALKLAERYARARLWDIAETAIAKGYTVTVMADYVIIGKPLTFISKGAVASLNVNQSPFDVEWLDAIEDMFEEG